MDTSSCTTPCRPARRDTYPKVFIDPNSIVLTSAKRECRTLSLKDLDDYLLTYITGLSMGFDFRDEPMETESIEYAFGMVIRWYYPN